MPRRIVVCALALVAAAIARPRAALAQSQADAGADVAAADAGSAVAAADASSLPSFEVQAPSRPCAIEAEYDRAFQHVVDGDLHAAETDLVHVTSQCPEHPHASDLLTRVRARITRDALAGTPARSDRGANAPPRADAQLGAPERPSGFARAELVIVQGLVGGANGTWVCAWARCGFGWASALGLGTAGLSALAAFGASSGGIRPGQATVVNSGAVWGGYLGVLTSVVAAGGLASIAPDGAVIAGLPIGSVLGVGTGTALAMLARPRAGQVSLVNSGGFWGGWLGGWIAAAVSVSLVSPGPSAMAEPFYRPFAVSQLLGVSLGLIGSAFAAARYPVSRARMFIADLGGVLGGIAGFGIAAPIMFGWFLPGTLSAGLAIIGGMGAAGYGITLGVTHFLDYPGRSAVAPDLRASLIPLGPNGQPGLSVLGEF